MISCSNFPPTACLHVACVVQQKDARQWFSELSVDMDKVRAASVSKIIFECFGVLCELIKAGIHPHVSLKPFFQCDVFLLKRNKHPESKMSVFPF